MPHLFRPYADSVARAILLAIVVVLFLLIGLGFWITSSEYVTDRTLTLDQPVPFSHEHHAGGLGITPASRPPQLPVCDRRAPA
jgi:hypothetical protein